MKVRELQAALSGCDPDADVILQKDAEGNGYSPLHAADYDAVYVPDSAWGGTVYSTRWSAADADMDADEWAETLKHPHCLVLAPVN